MGRNNTINLVVIFEQALSCSSEYVLLSEANIGNLQSLIGKCHQSGKKVLIHLEL
ncbi:glycerol-3-phosphate responsive antiterminator, partial [Klebsiella grimontii]